MTNVRNGPKPEKLNASKCFPLFTQQRTSPRYFGMSVSCQKQTSTVVTATSVHSPDLNPIDRSSPSSSTCCARPPRARPKSPASRSAKSSEHLHPMRRLLPKLRLYPILKASCSSLRPARARPAVRRRRRPLPPPPPPPPPPQDLRA